MAAVMAAGVAVAADKTAVLQYRDQNKWVAPADNKPLQQVLRAARSGEAYFRVVLPAQGRAVAVARLEILRDLLTREAKKAVVMEEVDGSAAAGTLVIRY